MSVDRGSGAPLPWHAKRSFSWGILLILDRDTSDVPESSERVVSQSKEGLAVKVRHAQDVDLSGDAPDDVVPPAQVEVEIRLDDGPAGGVAFSGWIDIPSGVLTVGDAEHEDSLRIGAGRWAVRVGWQPPEHAERVRVWLQRE